MIVAQALGTAVNVTTGACTVTWPTHLADDIALLFVTSSPSGTTETLSTASGFTLIDTQSTGSGTAGTKLSVYWCRATSASMASPVVTAGADFKYGVIQTYRGCVTTGNPYEVTAGGVKASASTSVSMASVTTTTADDFIVYGLTTDADSNSAFHTSTTNSNLTYIRERRDAGTLSGGGGGIAVITGIAHAIGATGTTTTTVTSSINAFETIALKSATPVSIPYLETFTGSNGAIIPAPWYFRVGVAGTIQSNTAQLTTAAVLNSETRHDGLGFPEMDDVDFSGTFHGNVAAAQYVDFFIASDGDVSGGNWEPTNAFAVEVDISAVGTNSGVVLLSAVNGVTSNLATSATLTITGTNTYGFRFQKFTVTGTTTVRFRIWDTSGGEPGTWDVTNSTAANRIGTVGIEVISGTALAQTVNFDDLLVTSPSAITYTPTGIATVEAFGTPTFTAGAGAVTASPTGIASAEAFGTATFTAAARTFTPTGIATAEAFGTPTESAALTASPTGIASAGAFGTPTFTAGALTASPTGIGTAEAFGTPSKTTGALALAATPAWLWTDASGPVTTASFTPATGELIVIKAVTEDASLTLGTPTATGGGITWTPRVTDTTASYTGMYIWTGVVTTGGSSITVTVSRTGGLSSRYSVVMERWTNAQLAATPATSSTHANGTLPSATLTTAAANSVVTWMDGDWNANAPGTPAYRSSAVQEQIYDGSSSTTYVAYYAYQTCGAAGSQTIGLTTPAANQKWNMLGLEVQAAAGSSDYTGTLAVSGSGTLTMPTAVPALVAALAISGTGTLTTPTAVPNPAAALAVSGTGTLTRSTWVETLVDNFSTDNRATLWPTSYGTTAVSGGVATLTSDYAVQQYSGLETTSTAGLLYTAVNSHLTAKVTVPTNNSTTVDIGLMMLPVSAGGTDIKIEWSNGTLEFGLRTAYSFTSSSTLAFAAGGTIYLGIAEGTGRSYFGTAGTAGNLYFYSSTDGATWTQRHTVASPNYVSAIMVALDSSISAAGTAVSTWDDINVPAFPAYSGALAVSGSGTLTMAATVGVSGALAVSGSGALTFTPGAMGAVASLAVSGSGALTFPTQTPALVAVLSTLAGSGALTFTPGAMGAVAALALSGSGTLTFTRGAMGAVAALSVSGAGTLSFAAVAAVAGSLAPSGTGTLTLAGIPTPAAALALSGTGTLTTPTKTPAVSGALAVSGTGTLVGAPLLESLIDDFAVDDQATLWPWAYGNGAMSGGVATVVANSGTHYSGLQTPQYAYSLFGSYAKVKITLPSVTDATVDAGMVVVSTVGGSDIVIDWFNGTMYFGTRVGYSFLSPGTLAVAASASIWIAVAEGTGASHFGGTGTAGNLYFYSSTDGVTWTQRNTEATPTYAGMIGVNLEVGSSAGTSVTATFEHFNIVPPAFSGTLAVSAGGTGVPAGTGLTVSGALALSGSGTLALAGTINAANALAVSGAGSLTFASVLGLAGSLGLSGTGSLTFAPIVGFARPIAFSGAGSLVLAGTGAMANALALSGSGATVRTGIPAVGAGALALGAAASLSLTPGLLTQTGTPLGLTGSGTATFAGAIGGVSNSLAFSATGVLSGSGAIGAVNALALDADGSLMQLGSNEFGATIFASASASLAQDPVVAVSGSLALSGLGVLTMPLRMFGSGALTLAGSAAFAGARALAGAGTLSFALAGMGATATLARAATGTLSSAGTAAPAAELAFSADGTDALSGIPKPRFAQGLDASGTLGLLATVAQSASTGYVGDGSLAVSGTAGLAGPLALAGSGGLALAGDASDVPGTISAGGSGTLNTAAAYPGLKQNLDRSGDGSLTAHIAGQTATATMGVSASGSLTALGTVLATCPLTATGALSLTAVVGLTGSPVASSTTGSLGMITGFGGLFAGSASGSLALDLAGLVPAADLTLGADGGTALSWEILWEAALALHMHGTLSSGVPLPEVGGSIDRDVSGGLDGLIADMTVGQLLQFAADGAHDLWMFPPKYGTLWLVASCTSNVMWVPGLVTARIVPRRYHVNITTDRSTVQI